MPYPAVTEKLRVVLVVPNFRWSNWEQNTLWHYIPYNLCLLAAMVKDLCEVTIIDANVSEMDENGFARALEASQPDVVGITVLMDHYAPAAHKAAAIAKSIGKEVKVILGGVYATVNPSLAMNDSNIDYLVVGEGEYVFRELLGYFMGQNSMPEKGVSYRSNGDTVHTGHSDFIKTLDALPLPAYDLIDFDKYANSAFRRSVDSPRRFPYARIMTSRGCPLNCVFCQVESISGRLFRPRSAENVLQEIEWLKTTYGIESLIFDDDNLLVQRNRAVQIFQGMIDRGLAMPWVAVAIAEFSLDEELIDLMRASGCEYIDVAIESGTKRLLKEIIKKPVNFEHARKMIAKARREGIYVAGNFIIGFPTETWDEIRQTIKLAEELDLDYVKIFDLIPLRNTRLWDLCEKENCLKEGFDSSNVIWDSGQIETGHFTARDLTILRAYEWDRINFTDPIKRKRTAGMLGMTESELLQNRRTTLDKASGRKE